jgi:hypothetical protein
MRAISLQGPYDEKIYRSTLLTKDLNHKVSGTIIRGTLNDPKHGSKTPSRQTVKTDSSGQSQSFVYQGTRSRLVRARPRARTVVPDEFTYRPRVPLRQRAHPRLSQRQALSCKRPWPNRLTSRPYCMSI